MGNHLQDPIGKIRIFQPGHSKGIEGIGSGKFSQIGVKAFGLVPQKALLLLAKIAGRLLALYMILKIMDTLFWRYGVVPRAGLSFMDFYRQGPYGVWLIIVEIIFCGIVPAITLLLPKARSHEGWLIFACFLTCAGIVLNRFVFIILSLAIPVMPFDRFWSYLPTWQEWGIAMALIGYGFLLFSASYRYLPIFPKEKELNPAVP